MDYQAMNDKELIALLFTEEDRLPRAAVDECIRRADRFVEPLADIVSQQKYWQEVLPFWWAVVHATFILGAIATRETVEPLLKALQFSADFDCDWVAEALASIFGKVGVPALEGLKAIAVDQNREWYPRVGAIGSLAAITIANPEVEDEVFGLLGSIFTGEEEPWDVRQSTGNTLLDYQREEFKAALFSFGQKERELRKKDLFYFAAFYDDDVERAFKAPEKNLWHYTQDWLSFYDQDEIRERQERWREEDRRRRRQEQKVREKILHAGPEPFVRETPKVGRNEPCPCGSGKKFKKCCG